MFPDVNECHSDPCAHNGTCIGGVNSFTCSCVEGYTGLDCETGIYNKYIVSTCIHNSLTMVVTDRRILVYIRTSNALLGYKVW